MKKNRMGKTLRQLRENAGKTRQQVANDLGFTEEQIAWFEGNRSTPNRKRLPAIAKYYGVKLEVLTALTNLLPHNIPIEIDEDTPR